MPKEADKIYAIGDIHGMYDKLIDALADIPEDAGKVVFLGDYIDRGYDSAKVVKLIRELQRKDPEKWNPLKGNHEDMMVASLLENVDHGMWIVNGGVQTLESYSREEVDANDDARWMKNLPMTIETDNHVFVHAGFKPGIDWKLQPHNIIMWIRNWWNEEYDFGKHVVYGHTPFENPRLLQFSSGIDTGACFGGKLTVATFDRNEKSGPIRIRKY